MIVLRAIPAMVFLLHVSSALNYGGGGGGGGYGGGGGGYGGGGGGGYGGGGGGGYGHGYQEEIPSKIIVKHIPKHVNIYKPIPYPKPVPVAKPVGFLKPLAIAKPFSVPHVVPVIKHFQKPFPVLKGFPIHFPIPLPKLVKLPFQIKLPKPYVVRVPKPYAVAKKFPVAVPVHIPRPYVVPIYKPVPVGVPHKVPKVINVYKEVPEYVKKPVPVYVEEQPYKPEGNHKGTPYVPSGGNKGSPFPSGVGGGYKGTPFPGGVGGGNKGSPFPSGGHKGTPYGNGGGGGGGGGGYHAKGTNVHATSAANFLAAHAGKLQSSHNSAYQDILAAYSQHQGFAGLQGLGGGIHGGYHGGQDFGGYQGISGHNFDFHGGYGSGSQGHGVYEGLGGFDEASVYGRGTGVDTPKDSGLEASHQEGYSHNTGIDGGNSEGVSYDNNQAGDESNSYNEGQGHGGYNNNQGYVGVSVSTFDDHAGRGGGYTDQSNSGGYSDQVGHDNQALGNQDHGIVNNNQGYDASVSQGQGENGYQHAPTLSIYQVPNGGATAINFPNAGANFYNTGFQSQHSYGNQADSGQGYSQNHVGNAGYENQAYQGNEGSDDSYKGSHQQASYGYKTNHPVAASQQHNQEFPLHQAQENDGGYTLKDSSYQSEESFNNNQNAGYQNQGIYNNQATSEVYHNQGYQVNNAPAAEAGYGHANLAPGLQNYGLRAAYQVQPGADNHNQLQGASGTVYVRAYDNNQGDSNQAPYSVKTADSYQTQDSTQQNSYSSFSSTRNAEPVSEKDAAEDKDQLPAASGRSYDAEEKLPAASSGYSTLEGGDAKGGSWRVVKQ